MNLRQPNNRFFATTFIIFFACCRNVTAADDGFTPLFNGKDLTGWVKVGPAGFEVKDGILKCTGQGNYPTWLRTEEVFENFELRVEYRPLYGAEGGVFFSAPLCGRIPHVGFDVRLGDNTGRLGDYSPGAIFEAVPPLVEAARKWDDPDWNRFEITMNWPKLHVVLNGKVVQDLNLEQNESLRYRPRFGYIGLQDRGKPILFRKVDIRRLPGKTRDQWQAFFNGKDLTGFTITKDCTARWSVDHGEILAENGHGYLVTNQEYRNCEFQTYVKTSPLANSGVFFRWKEMKNRGFEIQIEDIPDSQDPTGSIYGRVRAKCLPTTVGEWYLMQVFLKDKHCVVRVNGETVAESDTMSPNRAGGIALQMHSSNGWVRFKDPMVRSLDAPAEIKKEIQAVTAERAKDYRLDPAFYKKCTLVQNILVASSDRVSDYALLEAAYILDLVMKDLKPRIAQSAFAMLRCCASSLAMPNRFQNCHSSAVI